MTTQTGARLKNECTLTLSHRVSLLHNKIVTENDPRERMRLCRQALGLGREAVKAADSMSLAEIDAAQNTLSLAFRESRGVYNPNASITKLAKWKMAQLGLGSLPIVRRTRTKLVVTDAACLALSDTPDTTALVDAEQMLEAANLGRSFTIICGADGTYSVELRLVNAVMPLLEPSEYKRVVEASPDFRLIVETGKLYFGAAENLKEGAGFLIENGSYWGSIVSLRGARGRLKHIATLVRSDKPIPLLDQTPEFREY